jgi:hypothetical protein
MTTNTTTTKTNSYNKKMLITTLFIVILSASIFVCYKFTTNNTTNTDNEVAIDKTVSLEDAVHVGSEGELKAAISAVSSFAPGAVIALDQDITLTETLTIPANKNIILTSNSKTVPFKLIGTDNEITIHVNGQGCVLQLAGITVTHKEGAYGCGVWVGTNSELILSGGKIADNTDSHMVGVYNRGVFTMIGGEISSNKAISYNGGKYHGYISGDGGGVYNIGTFTISGGTITNNTASSYGGGVYNKGNFSMVKGKIINNTAKTLGGGVYNLGSIFDLSGGTITNNTAESGGGVYNTATFTMIGGTITSNTAQYGGGICSVYNSYYIYSEYSFDRSGGMVSNNKATEKSDNLYVTNINGKIITDE